MVGTERRHGRLIFKKKLVMPFLQIGFFPGLDLTIEEIPVQYAFVKVIRTCFRSKNHLSLALSLPFLTGGKTFLISFVFFSGQCSGEGKEILSGFKVNLKNPELPVLLKGQKILVCKLVSR